MTNQVHIDIQDNKILLKSSDEKIFNKRLLAISLRRLGADNEGGIVRIPLNSHDQVTTLQDVQKCLERNELVYTISAAMEEGLSAWNREQENFDIFAEKARNIRNNNFKSDKDLTDGFRQFKETIEDSMSRTLYPRQLLSAYHMAFSKHACNFSVPGAGKTSIVYGAYAYMKNLPESDDNHVDKILVIGPLSSFMAWEDEYKECFGVDVTSQRLSGDGSMPRDEKEQHLYAESPNELTLISHAGIKNLQTEIIHFLKRNRTMLVVDEAHRIKNVQGVWGNSAVEISKEACSRVVLTGTPLPNGYEDLYNLFRFLYPFKYKDILQIHYDQLKELTKGSVGADDSRTNQFVHNIKPYFIRIKKADLKLPECKDTIINGKMDSLQRKIYDFVEDKYIDQMAASPQATAKDLLNKARLIRLRQAATNPALLLKTLKKSIANPGGVSELNAEIAEQHNATIDDSEILRDITKYQEQCTPTKFQKISELLHQDLLQGGGKVIVWTIFVQNADELKAYLEEQGMQTQLLIGRIPQKEREDIVKRFNDPLNLEFQVVIANPFSVSESISLHKGCHNAIYMERDYNAANFLQSKDRIHRVGMRDDVTTNYYYLVSDDSIDSIIHRRLDDKIKRMQAVIDDDIPLLQRVDDDDETDIVTDIIKDYYARKPDEL